MKYHEIFKVSYSEHGWATTHWTSQFPSPHGSLTAACGMNFSLDLNSRPCSRKTGLRQGSHSHTCPSKTWTLATASNNCRNGLRELRDPYLFVWLCERSPQGTTHSSAHFLATGTKQLWKKAFNNTSAAALCIWALLCPIAFCAFWTHHLEKQMSIPSIRNTTIFPTSLSRCECWLTSARHLFLNPPEKAS